MRKQWFEVDKKGLKELQLGKPKHYLVRELVQNALDEDITRCDVKMEYDRGKVTISVEDDSPVGFRDLTDAYTLFRTTHKRSIADTRGRFNMGEKQVFAICDTAEILTTIGGVVFDKDGRHIKRKKRESGSIITVTLRMKREEFEECYDYCMDILIPEGIELHVQRKDGTREFEQVMDYKSPHKTFKGMLQTELLDESGEYPKVRKRTRETQVDIHETDEVSYLYEMGLPVCEIDCQFSIDVQQKVPLGIDRDKVEQKYLTELYGMVLNHTIEDVPQDRSSEMWVREATGSNSINDDVVDKVVEKRWGDKVAIANPFDPNANDEAISRGYKVLNSWEIGGYEREKLKSLASILSTSTMFGKNSKAPKYVEPNDIQGKIGEWTKKVAKELLGLSIIVSYIDNSNVSTIADYCREEGGGELRFNIGRMSGYWELDGGVVSENLLDLIIHELGHSQGNHTDHSYHECVTNLGAKLALKGINEPSWFKI